MNSIDIENFLNRKGVKPTSNRILVAKELMKVFHPVSLADLETSEVLLIAGFFINKERLLFYLQR